MPHLVTVILSVGFPHDDETVTVGRDFKPVAEPVLDGPFGNLQGLQQLLELPAAIGAFQRRIGHAIRHMVNMGRNTEPLREILFIGLMDPVQKSRRAGICSGRLHVIRHNTRRSE